MVFQSPPPGGDRSDPLNIDYFCDNLTIITKAGSDGEMEGVFPPLTAVDSEKLIHDISLKVAEMSSG